MTAKKTLIFVERASLLAVRSEHDVFHGFRHNAFQAIRSHVADFDPSTALVTSVRTMVQLESTASRWTEFPATDSTSFSTRNEFFELTTAPTNVEGRPYSLTIGFDFAGSTQSVAPEDVGTVVLCGDATIDGGRELFALHRFFEEIGHAPRSVLVVRANFNGWKATHLTWEQVLAEVDEHASGIRFAEIYNFNFKAIGTKLLKSAMEDHGRNSYVGEIKKRRYTVDFIPLLEMIGRREDDGRRFDHREVKPMLDILQHALGEGDAWAETALSSWISNLAADTSRDASVRQGTAFVHWKGTGSLPPILGSGLASSPYPGPFRAAETAYILGLVECRTSLPLLTRVGRAFLDMLPKKAKDVDAPNRWHQLRHADAGRADEWLCRHFEMLKRAENRV
jgi:hypothetical protein